MLIEKTIIRKNGIYDFRWNWTDEFNYELTNGFTNFNGYIWERDLKAKDVWIATYNDLLYAIKQRFNYQASNK